MCDAEHGLSQPLFTSTEDNVRQWTSTFAKYITLFYRVELDLRLACLADGTLNPLEHEIHLHNTMCPRSPLGVLKNCGA
jgi:hypothetical protein